MVFKFMLLSGGFKLMLLNMVEYIVILLKADWLKKIKTFLHLNVQYEPIKGRFIIPPQVILTTCADFGWFKIGVHLISSNNGKSICWQYGKTCTRQKIKHFLKSFCCLRFCLKPTHKGHSVFKICKGKFLIKVNFEIFSQNKNHINLFLF